MRLNLEHLLDTYRTGRAAHGAELNVIQRKVIADKQLVRIQVHHAYCHVRCIGIGKERSRALMPTVVTELRTAQIKHSPEFLGLAVILYLELQLGGIVHFAVVVDVRCPEREQIGRTFLQLEARADGRVGVPRFLSFYTIGSGIKQGKVLSLTRCKFGKRRIEVVRVLDHSKSVAVTFVGINTPRAYGVGVEIDLRCSRLGVFAPELIVADD